MSHEVYTEFPDLPHEKDDEFIFIETTSEKSTSTYQIPESITTSPECGNKIRIPIEKPIKMMKSQLKMIMNQVKKKQRILNYDNVYYYK